MRFDSAAVSLEKGVRLTSCQFSGEGRSESIAKTNFQWPYEVFDERPTGKPDNLSRGVDALTSPG